MFPKMMEQLPARDDFAIEASLALVNDADVYLGLFAHRYGYIPYGHDKSITHMEYERAGELGIPRLIFLMDDNVPVLPKDYDTGDSAVKLRALKERFKNENVVYFFKSPEDLRVLVLQALYEIKKQFEDEAEKERKRKKAEAKRRKKEAEIGTIFISYSRKDQSYVRDLAAHLKNKGLSVWVDDRIIHGERWWQTIVENIRKCAAMVVVMTPESENTKWVEKEMMFADNIEKRIFPLLLEGECFPYFVNTQFHDVRDRSMPPEEFIENLMKVSR